MASWSGSPAQSSDDAIRRLTGDFFALNGNTSTACNMAGRVNSSFARYGCGMRFPNVTIPQGSTISAATISNTAKASSSGTVVRTRFRAQLADNPGTFTDSTDFDSRILTSGSVDAAKVTSAVAWDSIGSWTAAASTNATSPDLSSIIQAITDRSGWASGNAIVIFWDDFDDRSNDGASRQWNDYDEGHAPTLSITYTDPGASVTSPALTASVALPGPQGVSVDPIYDFFADADATTLASHSPTSGGSWAAHSVSGSYTMRVASNRAHPYSSGSASDATYTLDTTNGDTFDLLADAVAVSSMSAHAGLIARASTGALTFYYAFIDNGEFGTAGKAYIYKYVAGTATQLGSYTSGSAWTGTKALRFTGSGSSLTLYIDGVSRVTATDSAISSGYCGIRAGGSNFTTPTWSAVGLHLDNFRALVSGVTFVTSPALTATASLHAPAVSATSPNYTATAPPLAASVRLPAPRIDRPISTAMHTLKTTGSATLIQGKTDAGAHNRTPQGPGLVTLPNGNVFIAYADTVDLHSPAIKYRVLDADGNEVVSETVLRWASGAELTSQNPYSSGGDWWACGDLWAAYIPETNEICVQWVELHTGTAPSPGYAMFRYAKFSDASTIAFSGPTATPVDVGMGFASTPSGRVPYAISPSPPVQRPDGSWIAAVYSYDSGPTSGSPREVCVRSTDNMRTWTIIGTIFSSGEIGLADETALIQLSSNTFMAITRNDVVPWTYYRSITTDGGVTWGSKTVTLSTPTAATGSLYGVGGRPSLVKDAAGAIWLCARAMVGTAGADNTYPIVFRSTDDGVTWSAPIDPYTMAAVVNGRTNQTTRGYYQEGAFTILADGNVAHSWSEEFYDHLGTPVYPQVKHNLYYRVLTETGITPGAATASLAAPSVTTSTGSASASITAVPLAAGVRSSAPAVSASSGASPITAPALAAAVALPSAVVATTSGPPATAFLALVAPLVATTSPVAVSPERRHRAYRYRRRGGEW